MKILEVAPVFSSPFGGPVTIVRALSKELAKRHQVVVYTTTALDSKHDFDPFEEEIDGYRVTYFKRTLRQLSYSGFFGQLNLSCDMHQTVRQNLRKFDVVHVHSWGQFPDVLIHHYATKYGVPYVLQVHGSLSEHTTKQMQKRVYYAFFGYKLLKDASKVIALNQTEAEQYRYAKVPNKKIEVVPNALAFSEFASLPPKGYFRKRFNIRDDAKIILYLGRIHETKGIDLLIDAYIHLNKRMKCNNTKLLIIGPDDGYLARAKSIVYSASVSDSVVFTGLIDSVGKLGALVDANVFVTPSFYGFPMTFLEACAVGTPIVTTTLGDKLDWIDGKVGFVAKANPSDLSEKISLILNNKKLCNKFSTNGREIARNRFSIDKIANKLEIVYENLARGSTPTESLYN